MLGSVLATRERVVDHAEAAAQASMTFQPNPVIRLTSVAIAIEPLARGQRRRRSRRSPGVTVGIDPSYRPLDVSYGHRRPSFRRARRAPCGRSGAPTSSDQHAAARRP